MSKEYRTTIHFGRKETELTVFADSEDEARALFEMQLDDIKDELEIESDKTHKVCVSILFDGMEHSIDVEVEEEVDEKLSNIEIESLAESLAIKKFLTQVELELSILYFDVTREE